MNSIVFELAQAFKDGALKKKDIPKDLRADVEATLEAEAEAPEGDLSEE